MLHNICAVTQSDSYVPPEAPDLVDAECECSESPILVAYESTFSDEFLCKSCKKIICPDCQHHYDGKCKQCCEEETNE